MRRPHEIKISDSSQEPRTFGRPDLDTNKQIDFSNTQITRTSGLCRDQVSSRSLLYATAVSFVKPVCSSSRTNRWRKVYLAESPDCVIKMNENVSVNLSGGDEIRHKSVPTRL